MKTFRRLCYNIPISFKSQKPKLYVELKTRTKEADSTADLGEKRKLLEGPFLRLCSGLTGMRVSVMVLCVLQEKI